MVCIFCCGNVTLLLGVLNSHLILCSTHQVCQELGGTCKGILKCYSDDSDSSVNALTVVEKQEGNSEI